MIFGTAAVCLLLFNRSNDSSSSDALFDQLIEEETEQSVNPAKEEFVPYDLDPLHSTNAPEGVFYCSNCQNIVVIFLW